MAKLLKHQDIELPISSCSDLWQDEFARWYHDNSEILEKRVEIFANTYGIDKDDLLQNVALKAMLRLKDGKHDEKLSSFTTYTLRQTVRGEGKNHQRRYARTDSHEDIDSYDERIGLPSGVYDEPEHQIEMQEQRDMIEDALQEISQRYANALRYRYLEDADNKEACEKLGVSESLYRKHLERGRDNLRKVFEKR